MRSTIIHRDAYSKVNYISLAEWATAHGITPATARQRAERGSFKTAKKIGRNWVIDANEELIDHRRRNT